MNCESCALVRKELQVVIDGLRSSLDRCEKKRGEPNEDLLMRVSCALGTAQGGIDAAISNLEMIANAMDRYAAVSV